MTFHRLSRREGTSRRERKHGIPDHFVKHISTIRGKSERFEDIQRAVDSRVDQKGNLVECNFPRVHFEDPRVVWPMNRLVKPAQGPRSMIDTSFSRGRNSAATAVIDRITVGILQKRISGICGIFNLDGASISTISHVRVTYAARGIMRCMFRKMFAEFITDLPETF